MPPTISEAPKSCVMAATSPSTSSPLSALTKKSPSLDSETVIIFDWDDTLLASTFLSGKGLRLDSEMGSGEVEQQLKALDQSVVQVLNLALSYGNVHVITNAETGWVQLSAQKFMPGVNELLGNVSILSARSTYENMFPESPLKWKFYAFQEILNLQTKNSHSRSKNVISFGDSHVEREAVRAVTRGMTATRTKSVKFAERPSMEQLRRQIELVTNCFHYIHNHDGDLDLQLTVTVNVQNSNSHVHEPNNANTTNTNTSNHDANSTPTPSNSNDAHSG